MNKFENLPNYENFVPYYVECHSKYYLPDTGSSVQHSGKNDPQKILCNLLKAYL